MRLFLITNYFFFLIFSISFAGEKREIVFGQTGSFCASLGLYGNLIKNSINACFNHVNDAGGINGLTLRLESFEDYGDPVLARKNIKKMMQDQKIDMFLGCMGTRSILTVLPLIKNKQIAMFFPWGGHDSLRQSNLTNIINGLGYLQPQLNAIVKDIVEKRRIKNIAVFYADDEFSADAANYLESVLQTHGVKPAAVASYNRMTVDIVACTEKLLAVDPKVVICISTSMPAAKLINLFFRHGHYATEFVGIDSTMFVNELLKDTGAHFQFWSGVQDPNSELQVAAEYRHDIDRYFPNDPYNALSFAYYISASIIVEALKSVSGQITMEKLIAQIERMKNFDLGGFSVNFDENTRHAFGSKIVFRSK